jgi:hypothetical protein
VAELRTEQPGVAEKTGDIRETSDRRIQHDGVPVIKVKTALEMV